MATAIGRAALLVGPPTGLIWWVGWPLPTSWPSQQQVEFWLEQPVTPAAMAVAGWVGWATAVYGVVVRPDRRLRRAVAAVPSLGGLVLLLVGLPAGLIWWAGWPIPDRPSLVQVQAWLAEPLTWPTIVAATAVIGWLFWGVLVYAAVIELASRLGRVVRRLPRVPLPTPLQGLVGGLFGAAALTMNTPTSQVGAAVDIGVVAAVDQPAPAIPAVTAPVGPAPHADAAPPGMGVELPHGGWLARPVADAVAGMAAFTWLLRRHRYQPRPPSGRARTDPDLAPLPPTVAAVQAAGQTTPTPPWTPPHGPVSGQVVIGLRGAAALSTGDLPTGGVGLVGPGAWDTARGVLAAHLLASPAPDGQPRLITTTDDVRTLLGPAPHAPLRNLQVADSLSEALSLLERQLLNRARAGQPTNPTTNGGPGGDLGPMSLLVLTGVPPEADIQSRLAVLLTLGHQHQIHAVLLGAWPAGTNWPTGPDGTVRDTPDTAQTLRLTTLPTAAVCDLAAMAGQAAGTQSTGANVDLPPSVPVPAALPAPTALGAGVSLSVHLLGPVRVTAAGRPVSIGRSAGIQILVLLALHPAGLTSEQLGEAIWPDQRRHLVSGRFHTTASELRRTLHQAIGHDVIDRTAGRYHLRSGHVEVDVWQLRHQILLAGTAAGRTGRDLALRAVINLYRDELAAGQRWPWLGPHREAVRRDVIDAYTALAAAHPDQAVYLLPAAARIDPVNAHLHEQAIAALTAAGDHAAAAALTVRYARQLAAAGLNPDPDNRTHAATPPHRPRPH